MILYLAFGRMLKTTIDDSTKEFWLQQKVSESGTVNPNVAPVRFIIVRKQYSLFV